MAFLDSKHQRAAFIVFALGAALLWSLWDYGTGIIGIPVLAVLFAPLYTWLVRRRMPSGAAALVVTLLGVVLLVVPGMLIAGLLIGQAQQIAGTVLQSPIIARFSTLQVQGIPIGPRIAEAGGRIVAAIGSSAFGLVGTATRLTLNLTMAFAILPVVGSGMIWGPASIVLYMQGRPVPAILLVIWGVLVVGSVDNFIRPLIYRRFSEVHPLITLIGAIGGVAQFGLLGLLIGPLALSYFFELIRMYREEYLEPEA